MKTPRSSQLPQRPDNLPVALQLPAHVTDFLHPMRTLMSPLQYFQRLLCRFHHTRGIRIWIERRCRSRFLLSTSETDERDVSIDVQRDDTSKRRTVSSFFGRGRARRRDIFCSKPLSSVVVSPSSCLACFRPHSKHLRRIFRLQTPCWLIQFLHVQARL